MVCVIDIIQRKLKAAMKINDGHELILLSNEFYNTKKKSKATNYIIQNISQPIYHAFSPKRYNTAFVIKRRK
jgi:hypothetical protein